VQDRQHMRRIEETIVWPTLAPQAEAAGYKILAVWENGFRHVTNNRRPIVRPDDLRGIKLRTPTGQWRIRMFQAFGANPSPMPLSEVFVALQTGVMDGQENPFAQIYTSKLHEVQKYLSLTRHVYTPAYVTSGLAAWRRLPEDVRAILEATARELQAFVYDTADRLDRELLAQLTASGIQVNESDRAAFLEASRAIYQEFATSVAGGGALIASATALAGR
jgi:tripartite ATP-independent transporter DctP family solute receptor